MTPERWERELVRAGYTPAQAGRFTEREALLVIEGFHYRDYLAWRRTAYGSTLLMRRRVSLDRLVPQWPDPFDAQDGADLMDWIDRRDAEAKEFWAKVDREREQK